jgi:hypothetical protein
MSAEGSIMQLFGDIFTQPISLILVVFIAISLLSQNKSVKKILNKFI